MIDRRKFLGMLAAFPLVAKVGVLEGTFPKVRAFDVDLHPVYSADGGLCREVLVTGCANENLNGLYKITSADVEAAKTILRSQHEIWLRFWKQVPITAHIAGIESL